MKQMYPIYYILSVTSQKKSADQNFRDHKNALILLKTNGIMATTGRGRYFGSTENFLLIKGDSDTERTVKTLAADYGEDGYLKVYYDNHCEMITLDGDVYQVGKLIEINEKNLTKDQDYTFFNNKYYEIK